MHPSGTFLSATDKKLLAGAEGVPVSKKIKQELEKKDEARMASSIDSENKIKKLADVCMIDPFLTSAEEVK
jgi:hypothetical protein